MLKPDSLIERLFYYAKANPDYDALVSSTLTLSYAQLAQLVCLQAKAFHDAGISNHAVIGIKCADDIQHLTLCLATTFMGATSCTIPSYEEEDTQKSVIAQCKATYVVDENMAVDPVMLSSGSQSTLPEIPTSQAGLLFSTSGTTGKPKLVIYQDADLVEQAHRHIQSEQERFVCLASMEHNFAKRHRLYCVAAGASNVFLDTITNAGQEALVAQVVSLKANVLHVSAFQAQELLALPDLGALSDIRLKLGGSHVPASLRQKLRNKITQNLQAGYGTTETGAIAFTDSSDLDAVESVGKALPGIELRIVSPEREALGIGERGELAVCCDGMFRGYLGNPELTSSRLEDGWFYTGDIAYLDEQQQIHLCGRSDDMFVFNSMNIYPQDIESELCQFPDIIDAAVLSKASSIHGNIPVALVVYAKGVKPDLNALKKFIKKRVGVRRPRQFNIVSKIPRNASGKISRNEAINLSVESDQVRETIAKVLEFNGTNQLTSSLITAFKMGNKDIKIRRTGMDSLTRMELLVALEIEYNIVITMEELARFRFLGNIVSHVVIAQSQAGEQKQQEQIINPLISAVSEASNRTDSKPYVVRFFQRIFSYCHTAAQLNKSLRTLEHRLTPMELQDLEDGHNRGELISASAAPKFEAALICWLNNMNRMMLGSGKNAPEPFKSKRVAPTVTHFFGPGLVSNKTLVICFSGRGLRQLSIPNTVLMQYTNSVRYDLLVVSEPLAVSYQLGVPQLGNSVSEVINWFARLDLIRSYSCIRTLGYSAGGYPAIMAAYRLNAEMAVSLSGRFLRDERRESVKYIAKLFKIWRAVYKGQCSCVLLSYSLDVPRDVEFAQIAARFSGGKKIGLKFTDQKVHRVPSYLAEHGELKSFLASTIFSEINKTSISSEKRSITMNFTDLKTPP